jgi:hypothetical protein
MDLKLDLQEFKELWKMLKQFVDVFVWNNLELGCCYVGEHYIHTYIHTYTWVSTLHDHF